MTLSTSLTKHVPVKGHYFLTAFLLSAFLVHTCVSSTVACFVHVKNKNSPTARAAQPSYGTHAHCRRLREALRKKNLSMGSFDVFLAGDVDEDAAADLPVGLIDFLTFCRGRCSPKQLKELKTLYLKRKEHLCTLVEFMSLARDALGPDSFLPALAANKIGALKKVSYTNLHPTFGLRPSEGVSADDRVKHSEVDLDKHKKMVYERERQVPNMDVSQEAEDVLAIAGVNPDDEAMFMFTKQSGMRHSDTVLSKFQLKDKEPWRKNIELRLYARLCGDVGLASSNGIDHVNEKVYEFLEEALQVRLKNFVANVSSCAARRNDANKNAFKTCQSTTEPKQKIRRINVNQEREKSARVEKERQALLRVGQSLLSKRKQDVEENSSLKERVAKVRQEEEERVRADVANRAARSALGSSAGDAKYLKWFETAKSTEQVDDSAVSGLLGEVHDDHTSDVKQQETDVKGWMINSIPATKSIVLRDCVEAIKGDENESHLLSIVSRMKGIKP